MMQFGKFIQFLNNPIQFLNNNGVPIGQNVGNNPQQIIQYLMNTGKVSQEQYNEAVKRAQAIQKNPEFTNFVNSMNQNPQQNVQQFPGNNTRQ